MQENIKKIFDKRTKAHDFKIGDKVLKWDSMREDKGKHGNFDNLWKGPYIIHSLRANNVVLLQEIEGKELFVGLVNGRMLKHFFSKDLSLNFLHCRYHSLTNFDQKTGQGWYPK